MKIPPSGDSMRIPPQGPGGPEGPGSVGGADKSRGAGFEAKVQGGGPAKPEAAERPDSPQTAQLRQLLQGIDPKDPKAVEVAADKLVDWHLSEQFGPKVLDAKGVAELRASVRQEILGDPATEAKIRGILSRL
jgi:hypothetical protein